MYWPRLVVIRRIDGYTLGQVRKIGYGLASTRAAVPVPFLLHYIPSPCARTATVSQILQAVIEDMEIASCVYDKIFDR